MAAMRMIRRTLGFVLGLSLLGGIASAVAAAVARRQLVSTGGEDDDEFDLVTIYNGLEFTSRAQGLRRGSILTWYGGCSVDLREATLDPGGAALSVKTIFGGLEIVVPESWRIERNVVTIFGGTSDSRDPAAILPDGPVLQVSGWTAFGGFDITTETRRPHEDAAPSAVG
jgi:Cell wall-active antibiotics response 4TMS YvqF